MAKKPSPGPTAWLASGVSLVRETTRSFLRDNGLLLAAALSFYGLLSLAPLLLLAISAAGFFLGSEEAFAQVAAIVREHMGQYAAPLMVALQDVVQARGTVGGIGLLVLLWAGLGGIITLEQAVNVAWRLPSRPVFRRRAFAAAMLLLLGLFAVASVTVTGQAVAAARLSGLGFLVTPETRTLLGLFVSTATTIAAFAVIYHFFPNGPGSWRAALGAAVCAGLAWEVAKHAYLHYLAHSADFGAVWGPLGGILGLILWVHYTSLVLIVGAELSWVLYRRRLAAGKHA